MYLLKKHTLITITICLLIPLKAWGEVCSEQEVIPPFLTESIAANVLLLIDNSASMYDMAYDDIEEPGFCNDDSYIAEGTIRQDEWSSVPTYKAGSFVHVLNWNTTDEAWEKNWYQTGSEIIGGLSPELTGSSWNPAEWITGTEYTQGSVAVIQESFIQDDQSVLYAYKWYTAIAGGPACSGTNPETSPDCWARFPSMYGGYFENDQWYQWNDGDQRFIKMDPQPADSLAACTASPLQEKYTNDDLCEVIEPSGFSYNLIDFTAKGNYLNWLASSKLDVEKKVLTGGKYDIAESLFTMESRGCLGRRMIRQVQVIDSTGNDKILTMAVAQGEESSGGIGTDLPSCIASCTPADASCTADCNTACTPACQDQTCFTNCSADLNICYDDCVDSSNNNNQLNRCRDDCDTVFTTCEAGCAPPTDPACVTGCQATCDSTCITECENNCTSSWANVGLAAETTRIQFFPPTEDGFQFGNSACEAAIAATQFGQVQNLAGDCLEIGKQNESFANSNAAFNHGFQTCWGYPTVGNGDITRMINACENVYRDGVNPTDIEISDSGYVCMGDYTTGTGYLGRCLESMTQDGSGNCTYTTCTGSADPVLSANDRCVDGYVYACPTGYIWEDSLNTCIDASPDPSIQSPQVLQFTGNCDVTWVADYDDNLDDNNLPSPRSVEGCVEWALRDYCGELYNPAAPDAERPVESVADEHFPNLPAILVDVATNAQLGDPFKTIPALITGEQPTGLLQETTGDLHIGAMTFNTRGTAWEMDNATDPDITEREAFYGCSSTTPDCENRDGSIVIDYITDGEDIDTLVKSINEIKADTNWTPMAEALYNAVGYYTRDNQLDSADFYKGGPTDAWVAGTDYELGSVVSDGNGDIYWAVTDSPDQSDGDSTDLANGSDTEVDWELLKESGVPEALLDPVKAYCQSNNILVLTDGASTGDWNDIVRTFAGTIANSDNDILDQCGRFYGSTFVDDMSYYGQSGTGPGPDGSIYPVEQFVPLYGDDATKENIQTYVVTTGALRVDGPEDECRADVLLNEAAEQGGTDRFYPGEDFVQLQEQLTQIFLGLRSRASAGSAASVISASRGGEGAVYQAIFWPEQTTVNTTTGEERSVAWIGEVHGLFVDSNGFMFEDTNGDRTMNPSEDVNGNGVCDNEDTNGNGILDSEDLNCNGVLDNEDTNGNGVLDHDDPNCNGTFDLATEDINGSGLFDNEDTDCDGTIDTDHNSNGIIENEDLNCNGLFDTEDSNCNGLFDVEPDLNGDGLLTTEDTNGNCRLDYEDIDNNGCDIAGRDQRVLVYYDDIDGSSRGCYDIESFLVNSADPAFAGSYYCDGSIELDEVKYLWSAKNWLNDVPELISQNDATENRTYTHGNHQRYIFTWNDLNNDGVVNYGAGFGQPDSEVFPFEAGEKIWDLDLNTSLSLAAGMLRGPVVNDFNPAIPDNVEVDKIINWTRGVEGLAGTRNRKLFNPDGTDFTWKLGDVIHSTPMTVAAPAEAYHLIYGDISYAGFAGQYDKRRHVIYFGANDGMLHAVNGGFYDTVNKKFCLVPLQLDGTCPAIEPAADGTAAAPPALGAELWAYVPYNIQPHLQCLTQEDYKHKYMVDLRPRIFDAQIFFESDGITSIDQLRYPNGWGTILVGGMRLGGEDVNASTDLTTNDLTDTRRFISSYFILDITDPEIPPTLLAEFTQKLDGSGQPEFVDLGRSTVIPTMAIMKETNDTPINFSDDTSNWYLVFGSGPHGDEAVKGVSDQNAKVSIFPLEGLVANQYGSSTDPPPRPLRITPETVAVDATDGGTIDFPDSPNGFVSDPITIDFDISPSVVGFKSDTIYFGTVEGNFDNDPLTGTYWNGGGKMYRLMMRNTDHPTYSQAYGSTVTQATTTPDQWTKNILFDTLNQPITASPSVGFDGHNFWIYFGTGRFFDADDKTDQTQQSYYGIKEPMQWIINNPAVERTRRFTWETVEMASSGTVAGSKGLLKVDEIIVPEAERAADAHLLCRNTTDGTIRGGVATPDLGCLPSEIIVDLGTPDEVAYFNHATQPNLEQYIAGVETVDTDHTTNLDECTAGRNYKNCVDGWYKDFWPYQNRERNLGQATLLGGLVTFTTYQPFADPCRAEGEANLYGVYYKTGTAWYENIFGYDIYAGSGDYISDKLALGQGLATTPNLHVGSSDQDGEGPKAFVQTSTGAIKEIKQENLPIDNYRTGRSKWKEYIP